MAKSIEELLEKYVNDWLDEREKNRNLQAENDRLKEEIKQAYGLMDSIEKALSEDKDDG